MVASNMVYREIQLGVRPPRVAVLVSATWGAVGFTPIIEALSQAWAGATYALIPTDGDSIQAPFWRLLELHDPDAVVALDTSVSVTDGLQDRILRACTPFSPSAQNIPQVSALWPTNSRHMTALSDAAPNPLSLRAPAGSSLSLRMFTNIEMSDAPPVMRALVLATTGRFSSETARVLRSSCGLPISSLDLKLEKREPYEVNTRHTLDEAWAWPNRAHEERYPWDLSFHDIASWLPADVDVFAHPVVVVCGDAIEDFALYWTLRALRGRPQEPSVFWLPHVDDAGADASPGYRLVLPLLATQIQRCMNRVMVDAPRVLVTSVSLPTERLIGVDNVLLAASRSHPELGPHSLGDERFSLNGAARLLGIPGRAEIVAPEDARLLPYIAEFWERENDPYTNAYVAQFLGGAAVGRRPPPEPRQIMLRMDGYPQWVVETRPEGVRVPRRTGLESLLVDPSSGEDFRVCRGGGLAYTAVRTERRSGAPRRALLIEPVFRLPEDLEVFQALGYRVGLSLTPSDKGRYERVLIDRLGGLEAVGQALRDECAAAVLLAYAASRKEKQGAGIYAFLRRYLDMRALTAICRGDAPAEELANRWLSAGLLEPGAVLKCDFCRARDWYQFGELGSRYRCHRCSREQIYPARAETYFRLDEPVRLAMTHNSHIPLLALDWLRRRAQVNFLYATGSELRREGKEGAGDLPWAEVDLLAVVDGELVLGEGKKGGNLDPADVNQLNAYISICRRLCPRRFVAATDADEWNANAGSKLDEFERGISKYGVELMRLTGCDLR